MLEKKEFHTIKRDFENFHGFAFLTRKKEYPAKNGMDASVSHNVKLNKYDGYNSPVT